MTSITKEFMAGTWRNAVWRFELTMFNYVAMTWAQGGKAFGAWTIRDDEVIFTFHYLGDEKKQLYLFAIAEIIDDNTIRIVEPETNKTETLERVV